MKDPSRCPVCAGPLRAGRCLSCEANLWSRFVHRELVLLAVLAGLTVAAFFATRAVARGNEALRRRQAAAWFDAAQGASGSGSAETAVAGLRRAVSMDPGNKRYRLALADALESAGFDEEARRALLALRDAEPEDPDANLELARLEARGSDTDAARRYYQSALAGLWRPERADERRMARIELIEFLLAREERARALSELLVLAANVPEDPAVQARVGRMLLAAGDPDRALEQFAAVLRRDAKHAEALGGAGEAAFALGDYSRALRYLREAPRDALTTDLREVANLVLGADPLAPRLSANERRRRLTAAFERAEQRLDTCVADPAVQAADSLEALRQEAKEFQSALDRSRRQEPRDLVDAGVDLAYRIERAVEERCGAPTAPFDRALLLIGRRHGFEEQ